MNAIDKLIKTMNKLKASHLHLGPKNPQAFRIDDKIHTFNLDKTYTDSLKKMLYKIMPAKKVEIFKQTGHIRFVYISGQTNRYRITAYTHGKDVHAIIKRLSQKLLNVNILSTEELNLPPVIAYLAAIPAGLVICTGPENSGITTTLAAIINAANTRYRHAHVITIDNPIEYVHTNCNCLVEQLEISDQILSKQECLRNALNAETDIILCEGMDDAETISLMLDAASGGRLVLTTFPHYFPMKNMFESILKKFPAHYRDLITSKLANVFCAAISHEKFKRVDGNNAYCVANEILIGIPAVRALIREDKMHQLENMMKIGKKHGMQLMDESITGLYNKGLISAEDACMKAIDKTHFGQILKSPPEDEKKNEILQRIEAAKKSHTLDLSGLWIKELPAEIGKRTNLTTLDLSRNQLTSLPAEIGKLINLTGLYLNNNQITSLPEGIENLTNLVVLSLNDNKFTSFPAEILKLVNLRGLYLNDNPLTSIPDEIGKLANLPELYLNNHQIESFFNKIRKLVNLKVLILKQDQLTSLPKRIGKLNNLTTLGLDGCPHEIVKQGIKATENNHPDESNLLNPAKNDVVPPWAERPSYSRRTIGWRMGGGEVYIQKWNAFITTLPIDYDSRLLYLRRHRPAPLSWCDTVLMVLYPESGSNRKIGCSESEILKLLKLGLVEYDIAYKTWLTKRQKVLWPWSLANNPIEALRYHTREFWFFSRQFNAARVNDNPDFSGVPPNRWRDVEAQLFSGRLGKVDSNQGLLTLAQMLCAGSVVPPWALGLTLQDFTGSVEMDMGYTDAYGLWIRRAFDDDKMLRQMIAKTGIPAEWEAWINEHTIFGFPVHKDI